MRICIKTDNVFFLKSSRPSLPLKKAFSKTYPSFLTVKEGSTSHLGLLPSGKKRETALLGARNRYAIRLAGHQSPAPGLCGLGPPGVSGDSEGQNVVGDVFVPCFRDHSAQTVPLVSLKGYHLVSVVTGIAFHVVGDTC